MTKLELSRFFWQLGTRFRGHYCGERFKKESMYGQSATTKKSGCCRNVAVSGGLTVLQTHLRRGGLNRDGGGLIEREAYFI